MFSSPVASLHFTAEVEGLQQQQHRENDNMESCIPCADIKLQLRADGESDEVECLHSSTSTSSESSSETLTTMATVTDITATTTTTASKGKRKFPSVKEFIERSDDAVKRKIKPIQKWQTLKDHKLYLVRKLINLLIYLTRKLL